MWWKVEFFYRHFFRLPNFHCLLVCLSTVSNLHTKHSLLTPKYWDLQFQFTHKNSYLNLLVQPFSFWCKFIPCSTSWFSYTSISHCFNHLQNGIDFWQFLVTSHRNRNGCSYMNMKLTLSLFVLLIHVIIACGN